MIILITNRELARTIGSSPKEVPLKSFNEQYGGQLHYAELLKSKKLLLYPQGQENTLFDSIKSADKNKPWVFFVHGNNQTIGKNVSKALNISKNHDVNVIAFSWPAMPFVDNDSDVEEYVKSKALENLFKSLGAASIVATLLGKGVDYAMDAWKNYMLARQNAERSADDLVEAIDVVKQHIDFPNINLLVHSLGHHIIETIAKNTSNNIDFAIQFKNLMLHQADADSDKYGGWIDSMMSNADKTYLTTNYADSTLALAYIFNKAERLGQTKHAYIDNSVTYLDFSDGEYVYNQHEFFNLSKRNSNDFIFDALGEVFSGKQIALPSTYHDDKNGFIRWHKTLLLYRLEIILDPVDGDEIGPENILITSEANL